MLWRLLTLPLVPFFVAIKLAVRIAPERMLNSMHEEADLLFYQGQFEELGKFCEGVIALFPNDPKLHSMYAIALADSDPDKAADMARRAVTLSSGSL